MIVNRTIFKISRLEIKALKNHLQKGNIQECDRMLQKHMYEQMSDEKKLHNILTLKSAVEFRFRQYDSVLMNLENQEKLYTQLQTGIHQAQQQVMLKKLALLMLGNKQKLVELLKQASAVAYPTPPFIVIKGLAHLVVGQHQQGTELLLSVVNSQLSELLSTPCLACTCDTDVEQALWNLLIWTTYCNQNSQSALSLYKKVKAGRPLTMADLSVRDSVKVAQLWMAHRLNTPLELEDVPRHQLKPWWKLLYVSGESHYLQRQPSAYLTYLDNSYPQKMFLHLTQLFDKGQWESVIRTGKYYCNHYSSTVYHKQPQLDTIIANIMLLIEKAMQKCSHPALLDTQAEQVVYKATHNIDPAVEQAIPPHYLKIPFAMLFSHPEL